MNNYHNGGRVLPYTRVPYTKRKHKSSNRPQLNIRVCPKLIAALRSHPDWTEYDRGFTSGDSGTAKRLLYDLLGVELIPNDANRRKGGKRWKREE